MVCHQRLRGIDQEVSAASSLLTIRRSSFTPIIHNSVYSIVNFRRSTSSISSIKENHQPTSQYENLERMKCSNRRTALISWTFSSPCFERSRLVKSEQDSPGRISPEIQSCQLPMRYILKLLSCVVLMTKSQTTEMDIDMSGSIPPLAVASQSTSPEKKGREMRGRSRESKSTTVPKSAPTIRKSSQSPVKRAKVDAVEELQIPDKRKPAK